MTDRKPQWLDEDQAADFLGVKPNTLNNWRCNRRYGLAYTKIGRLVRYKLSDLEAFIARRTVGASTTGSELAHV